MRNEKVTCDGCGADLTTRSNSVDYRLVLSSETKPVYGAGCYTDMMIYPPVERTYHFCLLGCLDHWRDRERFEGKLWKEWNDRWKAERGTRVEGLGGGSVVSYPAPPQQLLDECKVKFEAAALEAFPLKFVG